MRPIDPIALAHISRRLHRAPTPPWLHSEVARRMAERLPIIRLQPEQVLDWSSFLGAGAQLLASTYPRAKHMVVDDEAQRARQRAVPPWWSLQRWRGAAVPPLKAAAVPPGAAQLLWANMALHAVADPQVLLAQWHRALKVDGFLMFSTLGPGSLVALRDVYARRAWPAPFAPFVDMHDLGDMLVAAGFADPVMDQELITLTWPSADALLAELRALGGNADPQRAKGLRTPRWLAALKQALSELAGPEGRLALVFEVVYGHAFKPLPRPKVGAVTALSADDLQTMARSGRPRKDPAR
jgi:malonyl-CoA O-methyltransferase